MARGSFPLGNPFSGASPGPLARMGGPGPADPTGSFNTDTINAALQPYGVQLPTSYQQPGPFENMGWGQQHPGLATGLDNALIAVAGMGPTGETAGENISNVARGVMGIGPYRRQYLSEQAMVPFQIAKEVGGLQAQQSYMQMQKAMAGYYGDRGQAALQANQQRLESAQIRAQVEATKEPMVMNGPDGKQGVGFFKFDPETGIGKYQIDPSIDVKSFMETKAKNKFSQRFGTSAVSEYVGAALANHYGGYDKIPDTLDNAGLKVWSGAIRDASPSTFNAALSNTTHQDDQWLTDQRDIIAKGMPNPKISAEDQKSIEDQAKGLTDANGKPLPYTMRRAWIKDQIQNRENDALKKHDEYMSNATEYFSLPVSEQQRMGGFYGFMQRKGITSAPPSVNPANPAPAAGPQNINDTINQMMGLLQKPQAR